ncbi:hypothetical protein FRC12_019641 [Ceratobasidium sp. 428]|nr:hypothetical protein FRC12_019641 [Ceratobasidium sp. 428]
MARNNQDLLEQIQRLCNNSPQSAQTIPGIIPDWDEENTPDQKIRVEAHSKPTIVIGEEQPLDNSTVTEADIIGGRTIPKRFPPVSIETEGNSQEVQRMRMHPLSGTTACDLPLPNIRDSVSGERREIQMPLQRQPEALPPPPQRQVEAPPAEAQPIIRVQPPREEAGQPEQIAPLQILPPPGYSSGGSSSSSSSSSEESDEEENPLHLDPDILHFIEQVVTTPLRRLGEGINTAIMNLGTQIAQNSTELIQNTGQIRAVTEATRTHEELIQQTLNHAAHGRTITIQTSQRIEEMSTGLIRQKEGIDVLANFITENLTRTQALDRTIEQQTETINDIVQILQGIDNCIGQVQTEVENQSIHDPVNTKHDFQPQGRSSTRGGRNPPSLPSTRTASPVRHRREEVPKGARAKKPNAFNRKRGQEAELFLMKMEVYFQEYPTAFNDHRRIQAFLTNMGKGEAAKWAKPLLSKPVTGEPHAIIRNWNTLRDAFLLSFSDPLKKERTIRDIGKLEQTGSTQHYVTQFRTLAPELGWDDRALIDQFKKGLKPNTTLLHPDPEEISLEQWIKLAIQTDDMLFVGQSFGNTTQNNHQRNKFTHQGKTETGKAGEMRVPDKVLAERRNNNECLKCRKKGHCIGQCKSKEWVGQEPVKGKAAEVKEKECITSTTSSSESEN